MKRRNNYLDKNISIHLLLLCKISPILIKICITEGNLGLNVMKKYQRQEIIKKEITILAIG